jgi:hypothetical protein
MTWTRVAAPIDEASRKSAVLAPLPGLAERDSATG